MVRFAPPPLARLVTLALQARIHHDGLAPAAVGLSRPLTSHALPPMEHAGAPVATGYRTSWRAAALDAEEPRRESRLRRGFAKVRRALGMERRPKGRAYMLFEFEFRAANLQLTTPEAIKAASAKWRRLSNEEKAPFVAKAMGEPQALEVEEAEDDASHDMPSSEPAFADPLAGEEGYTFFLFDVRAANPGLTRAEASKLAGSQWAAMSAQEKAPFVELAAPEEAEEAEEAEAPVEETPEAKSKTRMLEAFLRENAKSFLLEVRAANPGLTLEDASKLAVAKWRGMNDEARAPWIKSAAREVAQTM